MIKNNYNAIPKLDGYERDSYLRINNITLRILESFQSLLVMNPKPLLVRDPQDSFMDSISKLEFFKIKLAIQLSTRKDKRSKFTNQRTNFCCSNCKVH